MLNDVSGRSKAYPLKWKDSIASVSYLLICTEASVTKYGLFLWFYPKQGFDYPQLPGKLNRRYYHKTDILSTWDIIYTEFTVKTFIADLVIGRIMTRTEDIFQVIFFYFLHISIQTLKGTFFYINYDDFSGKRWVFVCINEELWDFTMVNPKEMHFFLQVSENKVRRTSCRIIKKQYTIHACKSCLIQYLL